MGLDDDIGEHNPDSLVNPAAYTPLVSPDNVHVSNYLLLRIVSFDCGECGGHNSQLKILPVSRGKRLKLNCGHVRCGAINLYDVP